MKWDYFSVSEPNGQIVEYRIGNMNGQEVTQKKIFIPETSKQNIIEKASRGDYPINDIEVHGGGYHCYLLSGWETLVFDETVFLKAS